MGKKRVLGFAVAFLLLVVFSQIIGADETNNSIDQAGVSNNPTDMPMRISDGFFNGSRQVTDPGNYYIFFDLTYASTPLGQPGYLLVNSNDVTILGQGKSISTGTSKLNDITGSISSLEDGVYAIYINNTHNITVQDLRLVDWSGGIYAVNVTNLTIRNVTIITNKTHENTTGIFINSSYNITIINCSIANTSIGINILNSQTNLLSNNALFDNGNDNADVDTVSVRLTNSSYTTLQSNQVTSCLNCGGFETDNSTNLTFLLNTMMHNSGAGIALFNTVNSTIRNNNLTNNSQGLLFWGFNSSTIHSNYLIGNRNQGIQFAGANSSGNLLYNNYFNNTVNVDLSSVAEQNYWNTSTSIATNIINGTTIAGNYWADACTDGNSDGICDSAKTLDGSNVDYKPLAIVSSQSNNANESSETTNLSEWRMRGRYLNHTGWDGVNFSVISGLNNASFTTSSAGASSPSIANGYVYVGSLDGKVYQLNASNISMQIASYQTGYNTYSTPAIANGYVYIGSQDHMVYQLNASNISQQIANYTTGAEVYSSPAIANGYLYIGNYVGVVYQLNASNISMQIANYTTIDGQVDSSPAIANGYLYIGSYNGIVYQLNASNISQQIANYTVGNGVLFLDSSPAIANGYLYIGNDGDGKVYQLNASNISQQIANYTTGDEITSSPAVANEYVYIGSFDHRVYQLNASNISQQIANYTTGNIVQSSPAIANGYLYIGSGDNKIYQLNATNISQQIANYTTGDAIYSSPAIANGYLYIGSLDGKVYQLNTSNLSLGTTVAADTINYISNCTTINSSGSYYISNNITNTTADIVCINITADNVTLNGQGFTLTGRANTTGVFGQVGISATGQNITIKNMAITNWTTGVDISYTERANVTNLTISSTYYYGVLAYGTSNSITSNCSITNGYRGILFNTGISPSKGTGNIVAGNYIYNLSDLGIYFIADTTTVRDNTIVQTVSAGIKSYSALDTTIFNNTLTNCSINITHYSNNTNITSNRISNSVIALFSSNVTMKDNTINGTGIHFGIWAEGENLFFDHDIDTSNTVDGKQIYFLRNQNSQVFNSANIGYFACINCTNITIRDFNLSHLRQGILLANTRNSTVLNITISDCDYGIFGVNITANQIFSNNIYNNTYSFFVNNAANNTIYNNILNSTGAAYAWDAEPQNYWNTSTTLGTNIMGGPYIAGNFWAQPNGSGFSQTCPDADYDGICDGAKVLTENNTDYTPLAVYVAQIEIIYNITNCTLINVSGSYRLNTSIINSNSLACINITSSDVIFDGAGLRIDGVDDSSSYGVYVRSTGTLTNVTIKNTNITDWAYAIFFRSTSNSSILNNTFNSSTYGVYLFAATANIISNNTINAHSQYAIELYNSNSNNITDCNITSSSQGVSIENSSDSYIIRNIINANSMAGVYPRSSSARTSIINNTINSNQWGIYLQSINNTVINNTLNSNDYGFYLFYNGGANISRNHVTNSNIYGIVIESSNNNTIYDNYFQNTVNVNFTGSSATQNQWNGTYHSGTNIAGTNYLGGNAWVGLPGLGSVNCADANLDGICDSQYSLATNNTDYLSIQVNISGAFNISIISPANATTSYAMRPNFTFNVTGDSAAYSCALLIDNTQYASNSSVQNNTNTMLWAATIIYNGNHSWQINCTSVGTTNSSQIFNMTQEANITECVNITQSGQYTIGSNITSSSNVCINITASNVQLNGQRYVIDGVGTGYTAISAGTNAAIITNITLININQTNGWFGIHLNRVHNSTVVNCSTSVNEWYGLYVENSDNNIIENNSFASAYYGIELTALSDYNIIRNNTVRSNDQGIYISGEYNNITNNTAISNAYGMWIGYGLNNRITSNLIQSSTTVGIYSFISSGDVIISNILTSNADTIEMQSSNNTRIENNSESATTGWSFYSEASSLNNTVINLNSTASFTGKDISIRSAVAPSADPAALHNISKYFNITNNSADSWIFLNISYADSDVTGINESSLHLMIYNGSSWNNITGSSVDTSNNIVYANISSFDDINIVVPMASLGDSNYPAFSNYEDNNNTQFVTGTGLFNVTIASTNGTAYLNFNGTSYLASNTSDKYNVSVAITHAGTYYYNWTAYGNGTNHNANISSTRAYIVTADTTAPNLSLNTPSNTYYNDSTTPYNITFNCSATDNYNLSNVSLYITNRNNQSFTLNQTTAISGTSNSGQWTLELPNGNYTWNCKATDMFGNANYSAANYSFRLNYTDLNYPGFTNLEDNNNTLLVTGTALFNVTMSGTNGTVYLNFNGTSYLATNTTNKYNKPISITHPGTYYYNWTSYGTGLVHNENISATRTYIVLADITTPNLSLNTPSNTYYNDSTTPYNIIFNCTATDNYNLSNISLYITNRNNASFALNQTSAVSGTSNSGQWTLELPNGNYTWNCKATDNYNNANFSTTNNSFKLNYTDTNYPGFTNLEDNNNTLLVTGTALFNVTMSGTNGTVYLNFNGTSYLATNTTNKYNKSISITHQGTYYYNWSSYGTGLYHNENVSETRSYIVQADTTAPTITLNIPTAGYYNDTTTPNNIIFNCSATDNYNLSNISLYITNRNNATFTLNQTTTKNGTSNIAQWTLELPIGNYTWNCLATDNYNNANFSTTNNSFKLNYTDFVYPGFVNLTDNNNTFVENGTARFSINVSNTNGTVYLNLNGTSYLATNSSHNYSVSINLTTGNYSYNWSSYGTGLWNNINSSGQRIFTVLPDTTAPSVHMNSPANMTETTNQFQSFTCTLTDNFRLNNATLQLWNSSGNLEYNSTSTMTETSIYEINIVIPSLSHYGNYTWTCSGCDRTGHCVNASEGVYNLTYVADSDSDSIPDYRDNLVGNSTFVILDGLAYSDFNLTINSTYAQGTFNDSLPVQLLKSNSPMLNFTYNFSTTLLNLSQVRVRYTTTSLIINTSDQVQAQNQTGAMYFDDNSLISLCYKNENIDVLDQISTTCTGTNETDFTTCIGRTNLTLNGITCSDLGSKILFENITYFAVHGAQASSPPPSSGGGGGGSGGNYIPPTNEQTKIWSFINSTTPATMNISRDLIAFTKIDFSLTDGVVAHNAILKVIGSLAEENITKEIKTALATPVYQYLSIQHTNLADANISRATIEFKVAKSWLSANKYSAEDIALYRYDTKWTELSTTHLNGDATYEYYTAQTPGFSYYAIGLKTKAAHTTDASQQTPVQSLAANNTLVTDSADQNFAANESKTAVAPDNQPVSTKNNSLHWIAILLGTILVISLVVIMLLPRLKKSKEEPTIPVKEETANDPSMQMEDMEKEDEELNSAHDKLQSEEKTPKPEENRLVHLIEKENLDKKRTAIIKFLNNKIKTKKKGKK